MPLSAGRSLSFYEVLGPLGAGGMGEVYRARDTRLERDVALKVLPPDLAGDPERMARFEREAKVLAALQHPGIVTVHSVEHVDGIQFLTMELVEGTTLGACIEQGAMPLERFYPLASAIAEAVHAAHKKGVTHRDLKPDNIILDSAGRPKVLDFGLAKRDEPLQSGQSASSSLTGEGRAMGTIPYMAPEALKAGEADSRSDVFSLGVVLYELLTGAHPFPAEDPGERISSILRDTPALASEVQAGVSRELARLLRRCLEKDPDRRLQTALDLRNELEELAGQGVEEDVETVPTRRIGLLVSMLAAVALAAILFGIQRWTRPTPNSTAYSLRALTATAGFTADPHWSPGGEWIAFGRMVSGSLDLFVQPVEGGEPRLRAGGPGDETVPRWSPQGNWIAYASSFGSGSPVHLVRPHDESSPRKLIETNIPALQIDALHRCMGDRPWAPDGASLLISRVTDSRQLAVWRVPLDGTTPEQLTFPPGGGDDLSPTYSFDGTRIAFTRNRNGRWALWTMKPDGSDAVPLLADEHVNLAPVYRPDGRIVFESTRGGSIGTLWELDPAAGTPPERITMETKALYGYSVSESGRLAYASFWHDTFLHVLDLDTGETRQITRHTGDNFGARFSPDGAVAYHSTRDGDSEIWVWDPNGGPERQITFDPDMDFNADWSPDGERLIFVSARDGNTKIYISDADGGNQELLVDQVVWQGDPGAIVNEGLGVRWSPDGKRIGYIVSGLKGQDLWSVRPDGTDARPLLEGVRGFDWYLDSRRIVYTSSSDNADRLFVHHLDTGERKELWQGKHAELDVSHDGSSVLFCTGEGHLSMSLGRLLLDVPAGPSELPDVRSTEPEILVQAEGRWHVHQGGWSWDSKRIVYTYDEDFSDVYELVEQR